MAGVVVDAVEEEEAEVRYEHAYLLFFAQEMCQQHSHHIFISCSISPSLKSFSLSLSFQNIKAVDVEEADAEEEA